MDNVSTPLKELNKKYPPLREQHKFLMSLNRRDRIYSSGLIILAAIVLPAIIIAWLTLDSRLSMGFFCAYLIIAAISVIVLYLPCSNIEKKIHKYVSSLIACRNISNEDWLTLWGAEEKAKIASIVTSLCIEHIEWKHDAVFIPDDDFSLMLCSETGDLDDVDCIEAIEREFELLFPDDFSAEGNVTFKNVVDYIYSKNKNISLQATKTELNKKYSFLQVPQALLDLIEKRRNGNDPQFKRVKISNIVFWEIFLVIGWMIWGGNSYIYLLFACLLIFFFYEMWADENRKIAKHIIDHFESRKMPDWKQLDLLWESAEKAEIARKINIICIEQIGWEKEAKFLPDDPFCLMIELYTGDLCEIEAIMAIEEVFSVKFPKVFFSEETPGDLKFKDVVDYIIQERRQN